jgi:hypothetical protein
MIYLKEIVDEIKSDLLGGMTYNESRFDDEYIETKIHAARATLIMNYMMKTGKFINDSWVQTLDIRFEDIDDGCDVRTFECPNVISLDGQNDGFIYVGHVSGLKPFVRIRKGFTTLTRHSVFRSKIEIMWDYKHLTQGSNVLQFYNAKRLTYIMVRAMFNNPVTIPNFDKIIDHYPVDEGLKKDIVEMVTLDLLRKTAPLAGKPGSKTEIPR